MNNVLQNKLNLAFNHRILPLNLIKKTRSARSGLVDKDYSIARQIEIL